MNLHLNSLAMLLFVVLPLTAVAQDKPEPRIARPALERVMLEELLDDVHQRTGKTFALDVRVEPTVVTGQIDTGDIDYPTLLLVLRNNGLATVSNGDTVSVVPVGVVRQFALPVLTDDDASVDDEEWVTRIIHLDNAHAPSVVPIIRPIMPQAGHFAAIPGTKSVLIVDRYGNVKRIAALLADIDANFSENNE